MATKTRAEKARATVNRLDKLSEQIEKEQADPKLKCMQNDNTIQQLRMAIYWLDSKAKVLEAGKSLSVNGEMRMDRK
jgi:monomeric isocitrate dehydrogenase